MDLGEVGRRGFLKAAVLAGAGAALTAMGCGGDEDDGGAPAATASPSAGTGGSPAPAPATSAVLGWREVSPGGELPAARRDHLMAYDPDGGIAYLFGGRSSGAARDDLWAFDTRSGSWRELTPSGERPAARFGHNLAWHAETGRLVLFGGQAGSTFFDDVWAYEPASARWSNLGEGGPARRYGAGGALAPEQGLFYVSHGFTFQGRFDDTWQLSLEDDGWREVSPGSGRPLKRCLLRTVWEPSTQSLLLFGGQSNSAPYHDDLWRFDARAGTWREIGGDPKPSARHFYAAAYDTAGQRLIVLGGSTADGLAGDAWAFETGPETWSMLEAGPGPSARGGHEAVYLPDRNSILVFGGASSAGEVNDLWELGLA